MVEEVTRTSYGRRIINSFVGILIGILLIIGGFILVFWNEGHGLHIAQSLQQTKQSLVTISPSPINAENNNKPIYVVGFATTNEELTDDLLNYSAKAIRLHRMVQMYQWVEHKETKTEKEFGGSEKTVTNYTYTKDWSSELINSSAFKEPDSHPNPTLMPYHSINQQAQHVTLGDFTLAPVLINKITNSDKVNPDKLDLTKLKQESQRNVTTQQNTIYISDNPSQPAIGDIRIRLSQVVPQTVSVIARQENNLLSAYTPPAGQPIALLETGEMSANDLIHQALVENQKTMWILRLVSLLAMVIGVGLILQPLAVLADIIPFIGSIVRFGTGIIAVLIGIILWGIATAIAWFVVRPLYAIGLLIIIVIFCYIIIKNRKQSLSV